MGATSGFAGSRGNRAEQYRRGWNENGIRCCRNAADQRRRGSPGSGERRRRNPGTYGRSFNRRKGRCGPGGEYLSFRRVHSRGCETLFGGTQYSGETDELMSTVFIYPTIRPALDSQYHPAVLANRAFRAAAKATGKPVKVGIALERSPESVSRFEAELLPDEHPKAPQNFLFSERLLKFLLWSRGGHKIYFAGPRELWLRLERYYRESPAGKFDAEIMGEKIYERPFEIVHVSHDQLPPANEVSAPLGRHLEGYRIGFDLGASDRKTAAVINGKTVFSEEVPWDPRSQPDPRWHFDQIMDSLKGAAAHLPRVEAIGGSSAGVYVNNQVKVASLFRGVPEETFKKGVKDLFLDLKRAWNNIPFEVVNDGEVTALA